MAQSGKSFGNPHQRQRSSLFHLGPNASLEPPHPPKPYCNLPTPQQSSTTHNLKITIRNTNLRPAFIHQKQPDPHVLKMYIRNTDHLPTLTRNTPGSRKSIPRPL